MDAVQAPANLLDEYQIDEAQFGDFSLRGDELIAIEPPVKGFPAWKVTFEQGEGPRVLISANASLFLVGALRVKPVVQEVEEEPSADE
jgi:hypothetical protein